MKKIIIVLSCLLCFFPVLAFASVATNTDIGLLRAVRGNGTYPYAPVIGSGYIFGNSASVGQCYIYVPLDSSGKWGVSQDGFLANATSSTISGVMYDADGVQYDFTCSGFSIPRYRLHNSSSYTYSDLYVIPSANNIQLMTEFSSNGSFNHVYPYIIIGFLGVVVFCMMRYRH